VFDADQGRRVKFRGGDGDAAGLNGKLMGSTIKYADKKGRHIIMVYGN